MNRIEVPARRVSEIIEFTHNRTPFWGQVSWIPDGDGHRIIEIFLEGGKVGSTVQAVARDTAVAASLALQFGTPIATLRGSLTRNDDGSPAGPLAAFLDIVGEQDGK